MAVFKLTMIFQLATNASNPLNPAKRIGGWTESWYSIQENSTAVADKFTAGGGLAQKRAALLPIGASIKGYRIQEVNPVGRTVAKAKTFPASSGYASDVPQMALLISMPGVGVPNVKRATIRGIPDQQVDQGEYSPTWLFSQALKAYIDDLAGWNFRGADLTAVTNPILTITAQSLINFQNNHTFLVGQTLTLKRVTVVSFEGSSAVVNGHFVVDSVGPTNNTLTIRGWLYGLANGGTGELKGQTVYPYVDTLLVGTPKAVVRKVGRPSDEYRGRRSKKRR